MLTKGFCLKQEIFASTFFFFIWITTFSSPPSSSMVTVKNFLRYPFLVTCKLYSPGSRFSNTNSPLSSDEAVAIVSPSFLATILALAIPLPPPLTIYPVILAPSFGVGVGVGVEATKGSSFMSYSILSILILLKSGLSSGP